MTKELPLDYWCERCKEKCNYKHTPDNNECIDNQVKRGLLLRG